MAVPFCLPDQNNDDTAGSTGSASTSQNVSGASSAMQSPLQSPVTDAHFMQAFYEALYRCTQGGKCKQTTCKFKFINSGVTSTYIFIIRSFKNKKKLISNIHI